MFQDFWTQCNGKMDALLARLSANCETLWFLSLFPVLWYHFFMVTRGFVVITDRGGHLHDALRLLDQMEVSPRAILTTTGPDVDHLAKTYAGSQVLSFPQAFSWIGKHRFFNPVNFLIQFFLAFRFARKLRPEAVVTTGASGVLLFCYFAKFFGARIYHIENLAQVTGPSITGRVLYPICTELYVQWQELLSCYGPKARYEGWVL